MTRLDAADSLAALMRGQIASLRQAAEAKAGRARAKAAAPVGGPARSDAATLAAERIRGISPGDPARQRKALRAFLECVFVEELGAGMLGDPAFASMIDHVERQFDSNPELSQAAAQAADALLAAAAARS
jgi:hypothetical protein